jgi:hypothetical protein
MQTLSFSYDTVLHSSTGHHGQASKGEHEDVEGPKNAKLKGIIYCSEDAQNQSTLNKQTEQRRNHLQWASKQSHHQHPKEKEDVEQQFDHKLAEANMT